MRHRLTRAILLLYPRRVRNGHGPEIAALIDDLIAHDGRSRTRLVTRLAVDGLVQRAASTATTWTVAAVMAATSFGGLAISDFAAADADTPGPATNGAHHLAGTAHPRAPAPSPPTALQLIPAGRSDRPTPHLGAILTATVPLRPMRLLAWRCRRRRTRSARQANIGQRAALNDVSTTVESRCPRNRVALFAHCTARDHLPC